MKRIRKTELIKFFHVHMYSTKEFSNPVKYFFKKFFAEDKTFSVKH